VTDAARVDKISLNGTTINALYAEKAYSDRASRKMRSGKIRKGNRGSKQNDAQGKRDQTGCSSSKLSNNYN
jgi:hypothetical protein